MSATFTATLVLPNTVLPSIETLTISAKKAIYSVGQHKIDLAETITGVSLSCADYTLDLVSQIFAGETLITAHLTPSAPADIAQMQLTLAKITALLADRHEPESIVWLDTNVRIPTADFLEAMAPKTPEAQQPRRVTSTAPAKRARPALRSQPSLPANYNGAPDAPQKHDAHVQAYEANIRDAMLREASETELAEFEGEAPAQTTEARLSAWAVSIAVASFSLPLAAPVVIYNVARGEDVRVASLAMGLVGLFATLDVQGTFSSLLSMA